MKGLWALLTLITSATAFEYGLEPVTVDNGVYCFIGKPEVMNTTNNGNMVNSCYVDTGRHWLVIDSGPTYAYAKEAFETMQAIKQQDAGMVINTHVHDDHWLGNGFFEGRGITVFGPSLFKEAVNPAAETRMHKRISPAAYSGTEVTLPTRFVDANTTLSLDGESIRLIRIDRSAHTREDLVVYLPDRQTLFAGDLVFNDRLLSLRDGNINGWIATLQMLRALPLKHIVGGHGERTDAKAADETYAYLTQLRDEIRAAIEDDMGIAAATKSIALDAFKHNALYDVMHAQNVETAYRTLEWEDE